MIFFYLPNLFECPPRLFGLIQIQLTHQWDSCYITIIIPYLHGYRTTWTIYHFSSKEKTNMSKGDCMERKEINYLLVHQLNHKQGQWNCDLEPTETCHSLLLGMYRCSEGYKLDMDPFTMNSCTITYLLESLVNMIYVGHS